MNNNNVKKEYRIAPSILSGNFARMEDEVRKIEASGADMIHLDVMDGCFVPNITFGPKMVADIRKITKLPLDAHLMISNPENFVEKFIDAGADFVTIHYEATKDALSILRLIKERGAKCGISINPDTSVSVIADCAKICDLVLIMSVFPGFSGQKYIEGSENKVREARELLRANGNDALIQIDGGISLDNAKLVTSMGADILVMGNAFFLSKNPSEVVRAVKSL